jgi:hypothetical protein
MALIVKEKLLLQILKEMNKKSRYIKKLIEISQLAYEDYSLGRTFFLAKRIYSVNKIIYNELWEYVEHSNDNVKGISEYLFHLHDWFEQFDQAATKVKLPTDTFIFERWENSKSFSINFYKLFD